MRKRRAFTLLLLLSMTLGCFRGYLALFDKGAAEPRQIFPCQVSTLPEADRVSLEKGIPVRTEEELNRLLEDFLS